MVVAAYAALGDANDLELAVAVMDTESDSASPSGPIARLRSLVRSLVQQHGGTIKAESIGLGRGATFVVQLPIGAEADFLGVIDLLVRDESGRDQFLLPATIELAGYAMLLGFMLALVTGPLYHASPNAYGRQALMTADVLVLQQFRSPEENGSQVHADGTVFYPYVGTIPVSGKTVEEVRQLITERIARVQGR